MDLFDRIEAARRRWDVLRHPFYARWSEGTLTRDELSFYAGEYRHAVLALADQAGRTGNAEHAAEERAHVDLWDDFARAVEADTERAPLPETTACAGAWTAGQTPLERLAILYAIESAQPAISQTKLDGLPAYGIAPASPAAAYFALHAERDHEHAAHSRRLLEERIDEADADRLAAVAEAALEANWRLLDGVDRA
jgi:pyrroloquinoline-quinone synthase